MEILETSSKSDEMENTETLEKLINSKELKDIISSQISLFSGENSYMYSNFRSFPYEYTKETNCLEVLLDKKYKLIFNKDDLFIYDIYLLKSPSAVSPDNVNFDIKVSKEEAFQTLVPLLHYHCLSDDINDYNIRLTYSGIVEGEDIFTMEWDINLNLYLDGIPCRFAGMRSMVSAYLPELRWFTYQPVVRPEKVPQKIMEKEEAFKVFSKWVKDFPGLNGDLFGRIVYEMPETEDIVQNMQYVVAFPYKSGFNEENVLMGTTPVGDFFKNSFYAWEVRVCFDEIDYSDPNEAYHSPLALIYWLDPETGNPIAGTKDCIFSGLMGVE